MKSTIPLLAVALMAAPAAAQSLNWQTYVVPESGAKAQIPTGIFSQADGAPAEGYGGRWSSADGKARLSVQSIRKGAGDTPSAFLAKKNPPADIVYRRVTNRFFVVSSYRGDRIWYNRCNFSGRFINCVLIDYPAAEKRRWDGIVTRISNTFSSGT